MNSKPSPWLVGLVGILVVCCCLASFGGIALVGWAATVQTSHAMLSGAASVGTDSSVPALATTNAPPPIPIVSGLNYNIIVPTPVAPSVIYPIKFDSQLNVVTYPVTGTTASGLSRSLEANALPDPHESSGRYYARTEWYLRANWNVKPTARGCQVDSGDITMAMTITVPMLVSTSGIPSDLLARWNKFVDNTIAHEAGHVNLNLHGSREYERTLGNFPSAPDCDTLKPRLKSLFDSNLRAIDRANVDYDATTQHGTKQGAVFP